MKQEQKELLLKDLSARVPYGVKILIQDIFEYSIVSQKCFKEDAKSLVSHRN